MTPERFTALTGQTPPDDFPAVIALAETILHARTMHLLRGHTLTGAALATWEQALALQAAYVTGQGGAAGLAQAMGAGASVTLGSFSISGGNTDAIPQDVALCPAAAALLPTLTAIGRGISRG